MATAYPDREATSGLDVLPRPVIGPAPGISRRNAEAIPDDAVHQPLVGGIPTMVLGPMALFSDTVPPPSLEAATRAGSRSPCVCQGRTDFNS